MSIFEGLCICCGIRLFKEDKVYNQIESLVPNFYKNLFQLLLEDAKHLEKPGQTRRNKAVFLNWMLVSFFKDTRATDHSDDDNEEEDMDGNLIHADRFLRFLHSDPQVWPTIMRELVLFIKVFLGSNNLSIPDCVITISLIAHIVANRSIAEFILSTPEYRDTTADALKEMGSLVLTSTFSKNVDNESRDAVKAALLFFVGFLDHWGTKFYKHRLPSAGPTKHYFVTRVGVEKRYMAPVLPHVAQLVRDCNVSADILH